MTFRFRNFSVSKLFHFFRWYRIRYRKNLVSKKVSDSVSKKNWYRKKYRIRYRKNLVSEKVSDSVLEIFGIENSIRFCIEKKLSQNLGFVCLKHGFVKFGICIGIGFETFPFFWMVSDSVSKKFGIEKSIRFGIEKCWYQKKVSDSVSFRFWVSSHTGM